MRQLNLSDRMFPFVRAAYYELAFGRRIPLWDRLGRSVRQWEVEHGYGDVPKGPDAWEEDYRAGRWALIAQEQSRYAAISRAIKTGTSVLDVGCGEGLLFPWIDCGNRRVRYTGIDISAEAITKAQDSANRGSFCQADAENFDPHETYDVIVFNESLYYFRKPVETLERYSLFLNPVGILIVSTFTASCRAAAILNRAKKIFQIMEETETTQDGKSWLCTVFTGRKSGVSRNRNKAQNVGMTRSI